MKTRISSLCVCVALLTSAARADDPLAALQAMYGGVKAHRVGEKHSYIYGAPMTPGVTEAEAAAGFLAEHGRVFNGPGSLETRLEWSTPSKDGRFVVFAYRQMIRGKEVEGSAIRIKVRRGELPRVDYAAARVAGEPTAGSEVPLVPSEVAQNLVLLQPGYGAQTIVGEPEVVALRGSRDRPDMWCWRVYAQTGQAPATLERTFYVDTSLPRVLYVRHNYSHFDPPTTGTVESAGMPAAYPWIPYQGDSQDLVVHRVPGIRVAGTISGGQGHTFTDGDGEFSLSLGQTSQSLTLDTDVNFVNEWYRLLSLNSPAYYLLSTSQTSVGSNVPLTLANANLSEEYRVAQTDTIVTSHRSREFFKQYISSTLSTLSVPLLLYPNEATYNLALVCNGSAGVLTSPARFVIALAPSNPLHGVGCYNMATHSTVAHEFGHVALFMIDESLNGFRAFHEGYGDSYAMLLNDDPVLGREQWMNGTDFRADPTSVGINCQFPLPTTSSGPCSCVEFEEHEAGQLLSGPWVRIRNGLKGYYGNSTGLEYARVLFGNWSLVTLGGDDGCGSAHPGTLTEVLSVTESAVEQNIICCSFGEHSITGDCSCSP